MQYNGIMFTNVFVSVCLDEYKQGVNYPGFAYVGEDGASWRTGQDAESALV